MTPDQSLELALLSLVVAALAVFVGPLVSWHVTRLQIRASLRSANKQILAPMRQQWIESLRDLISELVSEAHHLYVAAADEDSDEGAVANESVRRRMRFLVQKIDLMVNPSEEPHQELVEQLGRLVSAADRRGVGAADFAGLHAAVTDTSRRVFKQEWNRIREEL
jgi:hypothetical protein